MWVKALIRFWVKWHVSSKAAIALTAQWNHDQLPNVNLSRYNALILVNGNYSGSLSKDTTTKIEQWNFKWNTCYLSGLSNSKYFKNNRAYFQDR
jgi:hypothetical protein